MPYQFGSQSKLGFFLIPQAVPQRNGKIKDLTVPKYGEGEKGADHAVSVEVIGAIVGSMVIEFGTKFKCPFEWMSCEVMLVDKIGFPCFSRCRISLYIPVPYQSHKLLKRTGQVLPIYEC